MIRGLIRSMDDLCDGKRMDDQGLNDQAFP